MSDRLRRARVRALLCACTALAASPAFSQATLPVPDQITVVITATRTPERISRVGSAISVVPGSEISVANPTSLVDALRVVPGLDINENGGPGSTTAVRIRGANAGQTLVLIDGVRVNDPSSGSGEYDFSNILPAAVDRIEVLRGPQSALYGSDAIGGVINIITKRGGGPLQTSVQAEAGSYGNVSGGGVVTGGTDGWSFAVSGGAQRADGFSRYGYRVNRLRAPPGGWENDGLQRIGGYARLGYDTGWGLSFDASLLGVTLRSDYDAAFGAFPDTPSTVRSNLLQGTGRVNFDLFDRRLRNSVTLFANETDRRYIDVSYGANQLPQNTFRSQSDFVGTRQGVEYQGTLDLPTGFGTLVAGARSEEERVSTASQTLSPFTTALITDPSRSQTTNALFSLWQFPVGDRLTFTLGGRIDHIVDGPQFNTWRATAAYQIPETGTTVRGSVGTGGKAPTLFQRFDPLYGNANLSPETSVGGDVGIDQRLFDGALIASVTYFANSFRNLIDFEFTATGGTFINVSRARTSGVEVAASATFVPGLLTGRATYTYLDAIDEDTGLELARRPRHSGRLSLAWTPTEQLTIEPVLFLMSDRYSGLNQTNRLPAYARLDLRLDYKVSETLSLYARGENLTDTRYEDVYNYGTSGIAGYVGFRATW